MAKGMFTPAKLTKEQKLLKEQAENAKHVGMVVTARMRATPTKIHDYVLMYDSPFEIVHSNIRYWLTKQGDKSPVTQTLFFMNGEIARTDNWVFWIEIKPEFLVGSSYTEGIGLSKEYQEVDCLRAGTWLFCGTPEDIASRQTALDNMALARKADWDDIMKRTLAPRDKISSIKKEIPTYGIIRPVSSR